MEWFIRILVPLPYKVRDLIFSLSFDLLICRGDPTPLSFIEIIRHLSPNPDFGLILGVSEKPWLRRGDCKFQFNLFNREGTFQFYYHLSSKFLEVFKTEFVLSRLTVTQKYIDDHQDCRLLDELLAMKPQEFTISNFRNFPEENPKWFSKVTRAVDIDCLLLGSNIQSMKSLSYAKLIITRPMDLTKQDKYIDALIILCEKVDKMLLLIHSDIPRNLLGLIDQTDDSKVHLELPYMTTQSLSLLHRLKSPEFVCISKLDYPVKVANESVKGISIRSDQLEKCDFSGVSKLETLILDDQSSPIQPSFSTLPSKLKFLHLALMSWEGGSDWITKGLRPPIGLQTLSCSPNLLPKLNLEGNTRLETLILYYQRDLYDHETYNSHWSSLPKQIKRIHIYGHGDVNGSMNDEPVIGINLGDLYETITIYTSIYIGCYDCLFYINTDHGYSFDGEDQELDLRGIVRVDIKCSPSTNIVIRQQDFVAVFPKHIADKVQTHECRYDLRDDRWDWLPALVVSAPDYYKRPLKNWRQYSWVENEPSERIECNLISDSPDERYMYSTSIPKNVLRREY